MADIFTPKELGELIGAPLRALVEAEAYAAQTTVQFIREVGFVANDDDDKENFGELRVITFQYTKTGIDGKTLQAELKVPVLSIVPIPALQIKSATIDFNVQLTAHDSDDNKQALPLINKNPFLKPLPSLRGIIAQKANNTIANNDSTSSFNMKISIQAEQADLTIGLQQIFGVLERGVNETEVKNT